jgi:serine/threonine protein kinase
MMSFSTTSSTSSKDNTDNEIYIDKEKDIVLYLNKQLGKGGFGQIYKGEHIKTHTPLGIKVEIINSHPHLESEFNILNLLQGGIGIPKIYKFISTKEKNYLIMELLGQSLDKLYSLCKKSFDMKTIIKIAIQMIERIEYIHSKGIIHRDIKPANFLIGTKKKKNIIYLIDYGLSKRYIDKNTKEHISYKEGKGLTGTARYVSLFTHNGIEQSRRDDIEGIAYNLIFLAKGKLPWQGVRVKNKKEKHKKIMEKKLMYSPEELCYGLPEEFPILLKYARKLDFMETPDYDGIKNMFKDLLNVNKEILDLKFCWESESEFEDESDEVKDKNSNHVGNKVNK